MCHGPGSSPPITPVAGAAVEHRRLVLTSQDGTRFSAFEATGEHPDAGGVVVMPDVRGLHPFYEELALRLAEQGHDTVAIDYFGRTAGTDVPRPEDFEYHPHVDQCTFENVTADVAAAIAHLRAGAEARRIVTIGFCFGGSGSWNQAAVGHGLAGAIGFYGHPSRINRPLGAPAVIDRVTAIECPILGLMGGDDPSIPVEEADRFRVALDEAGVVNDIIVYPGAPHSFFDRKATDYADAASDAWDRVLAFLAQS